MSNYVSSVAGVLIGLLCVVCTANSADESRVEGTLLLGGTGAAITAMTLLGEDFEQAHPLVRVKVFPSFGSGGGVRALVAGKLNIAFTSRPLEADEERHSLIVEEVIRTPFVFVSNRGVKVDELSLSDIAEVYRGQRTHWPDGRLIRPVLRPLHDTDSKILMGISPGMKTAVEAAHRHPGKNVAATDFDSAGEVERISGALGTSTTLLIYSEKRDVNIVAVEGISPSHDNFIVGRYPYGKTIYAVRSGEADALADAFIDYLASPRAHERIREWQAQPVKEY